MTSIELGNQHGYQCPACKSGRQIHIHATIGVIAQLYPDGTDNVGGDTEWDDDSLATCGQCDWKGKVKDLLVIELDA